jgi:glutamate carboxypeptidase
MPKKVVAKKKKPQPKVQKAQTNIVPIHNLREHLQFFEQASPRLVETVRQLVEMESPSDDKAAGDRIASMLAGRFEKLGGHSKFHRAEKFGNHLQVDFEGKRGGKPVLLLGHYDTVYPLGTLKKMPCRVDGGRVHGPGALDMK